MTIHGMSKIQNPFMWMGPEAWAPGMLQALAAIAEFGGGLALIVGLYMPFTCLGIIATMTTALVTVHIPKGHPFVGTDSSGSSELAMLYLVMATAFLFLGAGRYSLDAFLNASRIPKKRNRHKRSSIERAQPTAARS